MHAALSSTRITKKLFTVLPPFFKAMHTHADSFKGQCGPAADPHSVLSQSGGSLSSTKTALFLFLCPQPQLAEQASGIPEASFLEAS